MGYLIFAGDFSLPEKISSGFGQMERLLNAVKVIIWVAY